MALELRAHLVDTISTDETAHASATVAAGRTATVDVGLLAVGNFVAARGRLADSVGTDPAFAINAATTALADGALATVRPAAVYSGLVLILYGVGAGSVNNDDTAPLSVGPRTARRATFSGLSTRRAGLASATALWRHNRAVGSASFVVDFGWRVVRVCRAADQQCKHCRAGGREEKEAKAFGRELGHSVDSIRFSDYL